MFILDEDPRYPEAGDKFFIEEGKADEIAWLNKSFQQFGNYADSYQTAALNLLNLALKDKLLRDLHLYPAVFLIRHYIELRLKELIQGLNFLLEDSQDFPTHHKLMNLYGDFKALYIKIGESPTSKDFQALDELIKELSFFDSTSMAFRYPIDKDGEKTQKLEYINLINLKETFIRVSFLFDGVAALIADRVEMKEDFIQDIYSNYFE
tara:strand:+ start:29704 stop:30327 length:624 start_codon:yes stop_codon:yes gene_type:complete